ncbi:MAG TPA: preprotein translocase subunit SecE [Candidatus Faecalibacterium intestinigallinarum]|uniref:Protein translocase subunit SecE n=1 Tax=Candidatus Faecalibacterium intestinigallinarum TaxID=2838581 RepID=A0A9D1QB71_9FIRM|nr:preprotein translocase subunit SecE [Candidatus Faecalibacterium intestinigallinarum]
MADKTDKKPGFVARAKNAVKNWAAGVAKFVRDTRSELKKVVWPSKEDTKKNTTVVLVVVIIAAAVLFILDAIFGGILGLVIGG